MNENIVKNIESNAKKRENDRQWIKYFKLVIFLLTNNLPVCGFSSHSFINIINSEWQNALSTSMGPQGISRIMTSSASFLST